MRGGNKPDLRLAESYIPAVLLFCKSFFYTSMVPIALAMDKSFFLLVITMFLLVLYVDHLYLVLPHHSNSFLDTTAVCLDIVASNLFMLLWIEHEAQALTMHMTLVLFAWCLGGIIHSFIVFHDTKTVGRRITLHFIAFFFCLLFALLFCLDLQGQHAVASVQTNHTTIQDQPHKRVQSIHFFLRCVMYNVLVLVEAYTFRPTMQLENERYFFCKYGALLLSQWQVGVAIFFILLAAQILKLTQSIECGVPEGTEEAMMDNNNNNNNHQKHGHGFHEQSQFHPRLAEAVMHDGNLPPFHAAGGISIMPTPGPVDSDVMEAFRLAKQQYTAHHGDKTN